jgi:preprotein translocase subunit SecF
MDKKSNNNNNNANNNSAASRIEKIGGKIDFVERIGIFGGISLFLTIASLIYLMVHGVSWGIDFKGGTELQVKFGEPITIHQVRTATEKLGLGEVGVQGFGEQNEYIVRFQGVQGSTEKETNELLNASIGRLRAAMTTDLAAFKPEIRRVDTVGPQVGGELKRNGFLAVFYCLLVILIYVALRFDYKFAPGAVLCLAHDAIITLAIFVLVGKEVNVPVLAAILSLMGFSLNDTIVVFDRIRETEGGFREKGIRYIINRSINDMLGRTLITSGTTFVSALCLWIFADGTVSDIAFALCIGIVFGTYSSIYVAAPLVLAMEKLNMLKQPATA